MARKIGETEMEMFESEAEGQPMTRVQALENQIKEMEANKKMLEIEKGLHHLMEEMHPSKRQQAANLLKKAIGGVRGTPEQREKRRAGIRSAVGDVVKFVREAKAKKEKEFTIPTKYYENVLGKGWVTPEKGEKKVHHRKKKAVYHRHKHKKYTTLVREMPYMPYERYEPEYMRRRRSW